MRTNSIAAFNFHLTDILLMYMTNFESKLNFLYMIISNFLIDHMTALDFNRTADDNFIDIRINSKKYFDDNLGDLQIFTTSAEANSYSSVPNIVKTLCCLYLDNYLC